MIEWLGTTALVAVAAALVAMIVALSTAVAAARYPDRDGVTGPVGRTSVAVAAIAAAIFVGCVMLMLFALAIAWLSSVAGFAAP